MFNIEFQNDFCGGMSLRLRDCIYNWDKTAVEVHVLKENRQYLIQLVMLG